jgi:hypothetical protein
MLGKDEVGFFVCNPKKKQKPLSQDQATNREHADGCSIRTNSLDFEP